MAKKIPKMNFLGYLFFPHDQAFYFAKSINFRASILHDWIVQKCPKYVSVFPTLKSKITHSGKITKKVSFDNNAREANYVRM